MVIGDWGHGQIFFRNYALLNFEIIGQKQPTFTQTWDFQWFWKKKNVNFCRKQTKTSRGILLFYANPISESSLIPNYALKFSQSINISQINLWTILIVGRLIETKKGKFRFSFYYSREIRSRIHLHYFSRINIWIFSAVFPAYRHWWKKQKNKTSIMHGCDWTFPHIPKFSLNPHWTSS